MTNNEAKFILEGYRSNGGDADEALFQEALQQARSDPSLGAWLTRSRAHDAAITAKLREVTPPPGLREAILAGSKASQAARPAWLQPMPWLALAASIAVIAAVGIALRPSRASAEGAKFAAFALEDALHGKHGGHGPASGELAAMLSEPSTRLAAGLPIDFTELQENGCRTIQFAGHDVLEVCFKRDGAWFHCYIASKADFPGLPAQLAFAQRAKLASASWSDATHHFVLVGEAGLASVKRLL